MRIKNQIRQKPISMQLDTIRTSGKELLVAKYEIKMTISRIKAAIKTPRKSLLNY